MKSKYETNPDRWVKRSKIEKRLRVLTKACEQKYLDRVKQAHTIKSLVMTGASSGIGNSFLNLAKEQFFQVHTLGRSNILTDRESHSHFYLDLKNAVLPQLETWKRPSSIDALVLCAGADEGGRTHFLKNSFEVWEATFQVNFTRSLELIHLLLPQILESGLKTILAVTSMNIDAPPKTCLAYTAAKAAMRSALDNLRLEYKDRDLRVIEICPSITKTNFAFNRTKKLEEAKTFYDSFSSVLDAESVAKTMLWALNQDSKISISKLEIQPTRLAT